MVTKQTTCSDSTTQEKTNSYVDDGLYWRICSEGRTKSHICQKKKKKIVNYRIFILYFMLTVSINTQLRRQSKFERKLLILKRQVFF